MAGRLAHAQAVGLVVLFLLGSWGSVVEPTRPVAEVLESENDVLRAGPGDEMNLTLTTNPNTMFKLDLPDGEPLVSAELNFSPRILPTQSGFVWDGATTGTTLMRPTAQVFPLTPVLSPVHRPVSCGISSPTTKAGRSQIPTRPESPPCLRLQRFSGGSLEPMLAQPMGLPRLSTWLEAPMFRSTLGFTKPFRLRRNP